MGRPVEIQLDIETDWHRNLTVVGFYAAETGLVQLVGNDISAKRLLRELPKNGRLFTYNGHAFDLTCIRSRLRVDLKDRFESVDLRWVCQRHGYVGGQKRVERDFGFRRPGEKLTGLDAIALWKRYQAGHEEALGHLLKYNRADVKGLAAIKSGLRRKGLL